MLTLDQWTIQQADFASLALVDWNGFLAAFQSDKPGLILCTLGESGYVAINCLAPAGYVFMHDQPISRQHVSYWRNVEYQRLLEVEKAMAALLKKGKVKKSAFGVNFLGLGMLAGFGSEFPCGYSGVLDHRVILVRDQNLASFLDYLERWIDQLGRVAICPVPPGYSPATWLERYHMVPVSNVDAFKAEARQAGRDLFDHRLPFLNKNLTFNPGQISREDCEIFLDNLQSRLSLALDCLQSGSVSKILEFGVDSMVIPYYFGSGSAFLPLALLQDMRFLVRQEDKAGLKLDVRQIVDICRLRANIACVSQSLCFFSMVDMAGSELKSCITDPLSEMAGCLDGVEDVLSLCEKYLERIVLQYSSLSRNPWESNTAVL